MVIVTVFKQGGDFDKEYVDRIYESIPDGYDFYCISDNPSVPGYIPLEYGYPRWWSKMEMFRPDLFQGEGIFYFDLDTIITHDISKELEYFSEFSCPLMLSDFYFPDRLASGVMFIPDYFRPMIWQAWNDAKPQKVIETLKGDQDFLGALLKNYAGTFDQTHPDLICSYKAHITKAYPGSVKPKKIDTTKSKIVCFHGKPRPKDVDWKL